MSQLYKCEHCGELYSIGIGRDKHQCKKQTKPALSKCPKCGSIKLACAVNATEYQTANGTWILDPDSAADVDDIEECGCLDCGHVGSREEFE